MRQTSLFREPEVTGPWDRWLRQTEFSLVGNAGEWETALLAARLAGRCGLDIETTGLDPLTSEIRLVQLAVPRGRRVVGPDWVAPAGWADVWVLDLFAFEPEARAAMIDLLLALVADDGVQKILHNAVFELKFLRAAAGRRVAAKAIFDTMIASQLCNAGYYLPDEQWEEYCSRRGIRSEWVTVERDGQPVREKVWVDSRGRPVEVRRDTIRKAVRPSHTLSALAFRHLDAFLDKTYQKADWSGELGEEQVRYAARDAAVLLPLQEILAELLRRNGLERVAEIEFGCVPSTAEIELAGLPFDREAAEGMLGPARAEAEARRAEAAGAAGDGWHGGFNPDSAEQVLAAVRSLAEAEGLLRGDMIEAGGELFPLSSASEVAGRLLQRLPDGSRLAGFLRALGSYRDAKKRADFLSEWVERVHPVTGRLHPELRQLNPNGVGRFSAARPNVQQVPRGAEVRALFRAPEGRVLVAADYSAIEMRIMAELSGDENLIRVFQEGRDPHRATAAFVAGKPEEEVTKEERQEAKALGFGLIYGMTEDTLRVYAEASYGVVLSPEEARAKRQAFFRAYPGIAAWHERQFGLAWEGGFAEVVFHSCERGYHFARLPVARTLTGRMRVWPAVDRITRGGREVRRKHGSFTEVYNAPDQGTGADIIKLAMGFVHRELLERGWEDVWLVATTHDELVLEAPGEKALEAKALLEDCMLRAGRSILQRVPVAVECGVHNC